MAINLTGLNVIANTAPTLGNLILVEPYRKSPYSEVGSTPNSFFGTEDFRELFQTVNRTGFLFDFEGENTVNIGSEISDHFLENNSTVQQHIANRPITVTVRGFVGELTDVVPDYLRPLQIVADKLTILSAYTPSLSITALRVFNTARRLAQTASVLSQSVNNAFFAFGANDQKPMTKQQKAYAWFYSRWYERKLFKISTPWTEFTDMAIESMTAIQDEDTASMSSFEITFKQIRKVSTEVITEEKFQERLKAQQGSVTNLGSVSPQQSTTTLASVTGA